MNASVKIFGDTWKIVVLPVEEYKTKYSDDSAGTTEVNKKTVYISKDSLNFNVLAHEITHCTMSYLLVPSLSLNKDQHEELTCEVVAYYGEEICNKARNILTKLKQ